MLHDLLLVVKLLLKELGSDTNCWKYLGGGDGGGGGVHKLVFLSISIIINISEHYLMFNYYQCLCYDSNKQKEQKCT